MDFVLLMCYDIQDCVNSSPGEMRGSIKRKKMLIEVTKLNDEKILVNSDLIEIVETTPDTVVTLSTGRKLIVKESRQEIGNLVKSIS